jgi:hypothetical protein
VADKKSKPSPLSDLQGQISELAAKIEGAPATTRKTIGPPEEFLAERQLPGTFLDGDEWEPAGLPPADKVRLQQIMIRSGLLSKTDYSPAVWDTRTANAFSHVLALANAKGMTNYEDALGEFARNADAYGLAPRSARAPLVVQYENPEAVRQVIRKSSRDLLGRRLSDDEENRMISSFQAQNTASQQAEYGAGGEDGGAYTAPLSAGEYATSQLEGRKEAGAQRYLDAFDEIARSVGVMAQRPEQIGGR